ncbi:hypothetical protein EDC96DRAFT_512032 [Choanephora cucurbitarum]|nr:hypothetical protein EDC96DRAFT_512032 [Choanephora cucurbitarum]
MKIIYACIFAFLLNAPTCCLQSWLVLHILGQPFPSLSIFFALIMHVFDCVSVCIQKPFFDVPKFAFSYITFTKHCRNRAQ